MNMIKFITTLLLTILPIVILIRDWKFHDKRTRKHHNITRIVIVLWFICSITATIFSWIDSMQIDELISGKNTLIKQNNELSQKIDRYQKDLLNKEQEINKLKVKTSPRTINTAQKEELLKLFKNVPKGKIFIESDWLDTEAGSYKKQLKETLKEAGFKVKELSQSGGVALSVGTPGIFLIFNNENHIPSFANYLYDIFHKTGINIQYSFNSKLVKYPNSVLIWIGSKPQ